MNDSVLAFIISVMASVVGYYIGWIGKKRKEKSRVRLDDKRAIIWKEEVKWQQKKNGRSLLLKLSSPLVMNNALRERFSKYMRRESERPWKRRGKPGKLVDNARK